MCALGAWICISVTVGRITVHITMIHLLFYRLSMATGKCNSHLELGLFIYTPFHLCFFQNLPHDIICLIPSPQTRGIPNYLFPLTFTLDLSMIPFSLSTEHIIKPSAFFFLAVLLGLWDLSSPTRVVPTPWIL